MPDDMKFQLVIIMFATVAFVASLSVLKRWLELRAERRRFAPPDELGARLDRIENVVESTALEVERISEANRYLSKVLAERGARPSPVPAPPKAITPH